MWRYPPSDPHPCVDGDTSMRGGHDWVEVELAYFRQILGKTRQAVD